MDEQPIFYDKGLTQPLTKKDRNAIIVVREIWKTERGGKDLPYPGRVRMVTAFEFESMMYLPHYLLYHHGRDIPQEKCDLFHKFPAKIRPKMIQKIRQMSDKELAGPVYEQLVVTAADWDELPRSEGQVRPFFQPFLRAQLWSQGTFFLKQNIAFLFQANYHKREEQDRRRRQKKGLGNIPLATSNAQAVLNVINVLKSEHPNANFIQKFCRTRATPKEAAADYVIVGHEEAMSMCAHLHKSGKTFLVTSFFIIYISLLLPGGFLLDVYVDKTYNLSQVSTCEDSVTLCNVM